MVRPLVSIKCLVFNHAPYLRQCLDGFVIQKTSFPFEVIVHDDASSDASVDIIREYVINYPIIFKPIYEEENKFSRVGFSGLDKLIDKFLIGKYVALCEGDDYWTDPYKLQKQVDYLEEHPECGLVYTNSMILNQVSGELYKATLPCQSNFENLLLESPIMTLTTCYRKDILLKYRNDIRNNSNWMMGDLPLWLYISSQKSIKYMPDVTSVYRLLENSASHSKEIKKSIAFCLSSYEIRKYFAERNNCDYLIKKICINHINELFNLAISFDKNISYEIMKFAMRESVYDIRTWLKIFLYSTTIGRRCHSIKKRNY